MQPEFWQNRWQEKRIGFHLDQVNPKLVKFLAEVKSSENGTIFVPLCGKSLDLVYLAETFNHVIGIELVTSAVEDFFSEQGLKAEITEQGAFKLYKSKNITLVNGDIFKVDQLYLPNFDFIYDRASLVAFSPDLRKNYINLLNHLTKPGCRQLLISFDYNQDEMQGPPFSVPEQAIKAYYDQFWHIEKKDSQEIIEKAPRFADRGLKSLLEEVFILIRKG